MVACTLPPGWSGTRWLIHTYWPQESPCPRVQTTSQTLQHTLETKCLTSAWSSQSPGFVGQDHVAVLLQGDACTTAPTKDNTCTCPQRMARVRCRPSTFLHSSSRGMLCRHHLTRPNVTPINPPPLTPCRCSMPYDTPYYNL